MIEGYSPLVQTFLGTLFTWFLTAAGSGVVFFFSGYKRSFLDGSLGFAAGVMTAATFWSLLVPALEMAEEMNGHNRALALFPVIVGFLLGAGFVHLTDIFLPDNYVEQITHEKRRHSESFQEEAASFELTVEQTEKNSLRQRGLNTNSSTTPNSSNYDPKIKSKTNDSAYFRKILLLIIAVTVHNIPEGLAVGVGFGAIGQAKSATFQNARNLALGIGIQNFPEGLAVSLPLYASGFSYWKAFWYGQMSGMVEPLAGIAGTFAVTFAQSFLPYALAFAAGAMLYVVFENLMPEACSHGNNKLSTWCCMIGFCVMMGLDFGLG